MSIIPDFMSLRSFLALLVLTVSAHAAHAQAPLVPLEAGWPPRIAAGMRQGDQLSPFTVEARRDGWVIVTFLSTRPDIGLPLPAERLIVPAADVTRWTALVRRAMSLASDTSSNPRVRDLPPLGNGDYRIQVRIKADPRALTDFTRLGCGPGNSGSSPSRYEIADMLNLLDSAAVLAGNGTGRPPTLLRPYYASEVTCPARTKARYPMAVFPADMPAASRRLTEVGVQFVVDTLGEIEPRSITVLPGTDRRLERATRETLAQWHFRPAEWDGTPIRQVVQRKLVFDPSPLQAGMPGRDTGDKRIELRAERDGWVHFRHAMGGEQEWFTPDSVDAWVTRVEGLDAEAVALERSGAGGKSKYTMLGAPAGVRYGAGYGVVGKGVSLGASVVACAGASVGYDTHPDSAMLARFRAAAGDARKLRRMPLDPTRDAHEGTDVACGAWLPWRRSALREFVRVWQYPTGIYPASMTATNARAEVMVSVVVDTMGVADPATLRVMPGSDPRAVKAIPLTLGAFRFRPATRGGVKVPQRVIQTILFEPPTVCSSPVMGPSCTRRYTDDLGAP